MTKTVSSNQNKPGRVAFLDLVRILACFLVIVNHTVPAVFQGTGPSGLWGLGIYGLFLSKGAVPLFLMISGYTLLNRQDTYAATFRRVLRIAVCLVVFSGVYYLNEYLCGRIHNFGPVYFLGRMFTRPVTNAFWYLYTYLGLLIMLPFLQKLCSVMKKQDYHVFFFWSGLFFGFWPIVTHYIPLLEYTDYFELPLFGSYLCLLFVGSYVRDYAPREKAKLLPWAGAYGLLCLLCAGLTWAEYLRSGGSDYLFYDDCTRLPLLAGSGLLFYGFSGCRIPAWAQGRISSLARLTFGIFLVSDLLIEKLWFLYTDLVERGLWELPACLMLQVSVFAAGAAIAWFLKKIPLLGKWI